jgi:hypothetical protein
MRSMLDPYCKVLGGVFEFLMYGADRPGAPQNLRRAEVLAFARSRDAPAEIRLQGQLVRVMTGSATAVEILEIWREKELPRKVRRGSLVAPQGRSAPVGFPEALERELRSERLSSEDGAMLLQALRNADKGAAHRLALERWEEGEVVLESGSSDDHQTSPWIASLEPQDAAASPRIHAALRVLRTRSMAPRPQRSSRRRATPTPCRGFWRPFEPAASPDWARRSSSSSFRPRDPPANAPWRSWPARSPT